MAIFLALAALCLSGSALAHVPFRRTCPAVTTQPNFDVNRFLGRWYPSEMYSEHRSTTEPTTCTVAEYTRDENGLIHTISRYRSGHTGRPAAIESYLRIPNPYDPSKLKIRYPAVMPPGFEFDYWVLGSDYDTYAVVYNCMEERGVISLTVWILTRERNPPEEIINNAESVLDRNNINRSILRKVGQTNC